jgi:endonuclease/exonuclease/phosphatase family metal-dependent hydrolase
MTVTGHHVIEHSQNKISALTLNLRFGLANDGKNSWDYRKHGLMPLFQKYRNDFIGLQEVNGFQLDYIDPILEEYNYIGKREPAPSFWQNNVIFYKNTWECVYSEHFFLSPTPHIPSRFRESRWPRQCTLGLFKRGHIELICVNTHFDFKVAVQVESARIIITRLSLLPADIPVVVLGDFNATPSSLAHMLFTGDDQALMGKRPFLKNVFKKPFPCTHHGFTGRVEGDHIDWILYSGDIVLEEGRVIQEAVNGLYLSDHFPVYAAFRWQK